MDQGEATHAAPRTPRLSVIVGDGSGARETIAALAGQDLPGVEVLLASRWPQTGPEAPSPPGARRVLTAAAGDAGAVNGALAAARGELIVLIGAGDAPVGADLLHRHAALHAAAGPRVVIGTTQDDVLAAGWPAPPLDWLPPLPVRHLSAPRHLLLAAGGLDERVRDLDVAALDLLARLRDADTPLVHEPALRLRCVRDDTERLTSIGRGMHVLEALSHVPVAGSRRDRVGRRIAAASGAVDARRAYALGHGLPALPVEPLERGGVPAAAPADRPAVAVIIPFAGTPDRAALMLERLARIERRAGDEIVVVDNSRAGVLDPEPAPGIRAVRADAEWSSYHARNVGIRATTAPWLAFLDDDCEPVPDLLDRYFAPAPADDVGAVAGAILSPPAPATAAERHAEAAGVLLQSRSMQHRFRPYGVTANLLVRRPALEELGGFAEQVRSGGDADLCWRLGAAGWEIGYRHRAAVVHHHRTSWSGLLRQYRRYGAGIAWLGRRHAGANSRMVVARAGRLVLLDLAAARPRAAFTRAVQLASIVASWRGGLDHNRPSRPGPSRDAPAARVVLAGTWPPAAGPDPAAVEADAVEARGRALSGTTAGPPVAYAEDDGVLERAGALLALLRDPATRRVALTGGVARVWQRSGEAAVARRLARRGAAAVQALPGADVAAASLAGVELEASSDDRASLWTAGPMAKPHNT